MADKATQFDDQVQMQEKTRPRLPRRYKVLLHNDDYTPMDFVVMVLTEIFHHGEPEAIHIMLSVHRKGVGLAGIYTREIAETKVSQVQSLARQHEYPLQCSMEPE